MAKFTAIWNSEPTIPPITPTAQAIKTHFAKAMENFFTVRILLFINSLLIFLTPFYRKTTGDICRPKYLKYSPTIMGRRISVKQKFSRSTTR
ncbi:MAG: hypothetical protein ACLUAJ_12615 [Ruminococcus bicirculans (ex Wegman et al. 2014)]|uniref:hypothetical protein n=2 Tax=Ruminococcus TaxID=1263 RepID=UPI0024303C30|nr:hypothetical protein [Ruminococcus bicirculans (ex Wegman et al. 2014)]